MTTEVINAFKPLYLDLKSAENNENERYLLKIEVKYVESDQVSVITDTKLINLNIFLIDSSNCCLCSNIYTIDLKEKEVRADSITRTYIRDTLILHSKNINEVTALVFSLSSYKNTTDGKTEIGWAFCNLLEKIKSSSINDLHNMEINKGSFRMKYVFSNVKISLGIRIYFRLYLDQQLQKFYFILPENKFISTKFQVPGMIGNLDLGELESCIKVYLEDIYIYTNPSRLTNFEEELCCKLAYDLNLCSGQQNLIRLQVVERKIKICLHNGFTIIQPVPVLFLDYILESDRGSMGGTKVLNNITNKSKRLNENSQNNSSVYLIARNDAELFVPKNSNCAIIVILEYTFSEITTKSSALKLTHTIRWGTLKLDQNDLIWEKENFSQDIHLLLKGNQNINDNLCNLYNCPENYEQILLNTVCPDGTLCFTNEIKSLTNLFFVCSLSTGNRKDLHETPFLEDIPITQKMFQTESQPQIRDHIIKNREIEPNNEFDIIQENLIKPNEKCVKKSKLKNRHSEFNSTSDNSELIKAQLNLYTQLLHNQLINNSTNYHHFNYGNIIGPYFGSIGPTFYESLQPSILKPYLPINQKMNQGNILQITSTIHRNHQGLSRAACARLNSLGFNSILTESGESPYIITPEEDSNLHFDLNKELSDLWCTIEIVIQFLAYSSSTPLINSKQVFFTFQFYRFDQIRTPKLYLGETLDNCTELDGMYCRILSQFKSDAKILNPNSKPKSDQTPGYDVIFQLDVNSFKPGEMEAFYDYLNRGNLLIDVWDAKSHLLIGTCAVELKNICRQGKEAVQINYAADIINQSEDNCINTDQDSSQTTFESDVKDCLHIRLVNVGRKAKFTNKEIILTNNKRKKYLINSQKAGLVQNQFNINDESFNNSNIQNFSNEKNQWNKSQNIIRARPIKSSNPELQQILKTVSRIEKPELTTSDEVDTTTTTTLVNDNNYGRQQKLERLQCCLKAMKHLSHLNETIRHSELIVSKNSLSQKAIQLDIINNYREQKKYELIQRILNSTKTIEHVLYTSFGCTEFFEYELKNPFNIEDTIQIIIQDELNNLFLIPDANEVRVFKLALNIQTQTEDQLLAVDLIENQTGDLNENKKVQFTTFLKPCETVLIPMKYIETTMVPINNIVNKSKEQSEKINLRKSFTQIDRTIQVIFKSLTYEKVIEQLNLHIHIQPPTIDQSFRFFHPELSFLKKVIRLPPQQSNYHNSLNRKINSTQINPTNSTESVNQIWTRVSHPDILIISNSVQHGEIIDLLIKVGLGKSPQVREFLIAIYMDPFQIYPAYIWYWTVHTLQRVDSIATVGKLNAPLSLLLRIDDTPMIFKSKNYPTQISIHTSHPNEVILSTETNSNFSLENQSKDLILAISPHTINELKIKLRPKKSGKRFYQINAIDIQNDQVIRAWILYVDAQLPEITKSFNIELPKQNFSQLCNKRIAYTNPYSCKKNLTFETDKPELIQFKDSRLQINAGETVYLGIRFIPQPNGNEEQIYVFIKDFDDEKILETFSIIAQYC